MVFLYLPTSGYHVSMMCVSLMTTSASMLAVFIQLPVMFWGSRQPGSTTSAFTGVTRRRSGLFSTVFRVLHSAVMDTPMYRSSSRFFRKHRYFSSLRDSLVLATAKKWFLSTNQSPRQLYSTTVRMELKNVNLSSWGKSVGTMCLVKFSGLFLFF